MQIPGPTSGVPPISVAGTASATSQWQVGQLLQATVADNNLGKVLLAIGNRQVIAETSLPLQKGQQLALEVRSLGTQPVLKIHAPVSESLQAAATRLLLPQQGPLTPLLATLNQLAQTPNPPLPPLLNQALRDTLRQLPDTTAISQPAGLKKAIENSGVFLESRVLAQFGQGHGGLTLNTDFKANLLRLVHLVRNWPGSTPTPPPASGPPSAATASGGTATPAGAPQGGAQPALPAATPAQAGRVLQATGAPVAPAAAAPATAAAAPATTPPAAGPAMPPATPLSTPLPPPPLPGAIPVPQAAIAASLDLANRLGHLRTDFLQQIEAALARTQLQQLASLPREGERALLEWMLELPVRHGDSIELWSMRIFREPQDARRTTRKTDGGWTVQLAIDLPGLGPLQIQVRLANEQISTRFWAARADTLPLIRDHLHELRETLTNTGLAVGELDCQAGSLPAINTHRAEPLISEKA